MSLLEQMRRVVWNRQMDLLVAFMRVTNCIAPLQWMADQMGYDVVVLPVQPAHIADIEAQLSEAKRGRAA